MSANPVRRRAATRRGGLALLAGLALAGCGTSHRSAGASRGPGAGLHGAEPAVSPALHTAPAGRVVPVGAAAEGIVADPRAGVVAVAVRDPDRIALLSTRSGSVVRHVAIAGPARHLGLDGSGRLLVPEAPINRLLTLALPSGRAVGAVIRTGSLPHDAAAAGGRIWVADEFGHAVSIVRGGQVVGAVRGFAQPGGIAAVGPGAVALVDVSGDDVALIDAHGVRAGDVLARARAGTGPTHDVATPDGRVVYVADTRGGAVYAFAVGGAGTGTLRRIGRLALPGRPYGIALDASRGRLWVTVTGTNTLVEVGVDAGGRGAGGDVDQGGRMRVLARYPTVRQPNSVAVDPSSGEVYVAGADAGVVDEITPR